jgi:hypothetical protein
VHLTLDCVQQVGKIVGWGDIALALGPQVTRGRQIVLQHGTMACMLVDGQVLASWDAGAAEGPCQLSAQVLHASPPCIMAGLPLQLRVAGPGLGRPGVKLHARFQGQYLQVAAMPAGLRQQEEGAELQELQLALPALPGGGGLLLLEAEQGDLVSLPLPVLVLPEPGMQAELTELVNAEGGASEGAPLRQVSSLVWRAAPAVTPGPVSLEPCTSYAYDWLAA